MLHNMMIPLAFQGRPASASEGAIILAGDVGGTKTNLALYRASNFQVESLHGSTYHSASFASCVDVLKLFLSENSLAKPDRIVLGVAGPVMDGKVELTNLRWEVSRHEIARETSAQKVWLINDLEATAYGLAALQPEDMLNIRESSNSEFAGNIAIIAPGTGLGEAGLYWDGHQFHPFPTEGGHADFAPRIDIDFVLHRYLKDKYGIVSWERVISGPGIFDIYQFLCDEQGRRKADWLKDVIDSGDPSAAISQAALEETDSTCIETMQLYVRYLARESSNLVLKMKATAGLFLGGGIPPKITPLLLQNNFYDNFLDCDRMQHLLGNISIKIILSDRTALLGAAYYGAFAEIPV